MVGRALDLHLAQRCKVCGERSNHVASSNIIKKINKL
jgi:hypothetical protein